VIGSVSNGPDTTTRIHLICCFAIMLWGCLELLVISELFLHFVKSGCKLGLLSWAVYFLLNYCGLNIEHVGLHLYRLGIYF
jgi:hypothetical protein